MQTSFEREELQAPLSEINMTPLVDVMLVLLVIFLVTAPMLNSAIKLDLPKETAAQISDDKTITISINRAGEYFLNDEKISVTQLDNKLQLLAQENPKQQIHLRADADVGYGKVSHLLATLQRVGLSNIGFVTEPK
ncbi:MAG: biopolymer transporter ExbD [Alphaproteobacteria bacterium]|nr:biopolymer transporter ExbD [Alphaproteobacteria bacterium]